MAQATRIRSTSKPSLGRYLSRGLWEIGFFSCIGIALYLFLALMSFYPEDGGWTRTGADTVRNWAGITGAWFADITLYFCGYFAYSIPAAVALCGWRLFKQRALLGLDAEIVFFRILGFVVALGTGCGLASLHWRGITGYGSAGGVIGDITGTGLLGMFSQLSAPSFLLSNLFMVLLFGFALTLAMGRAWLDLLELVGKFIMELLTGGRRMLEWISTWLAASAHRSEDSGSAAAQPVPSKHPKKVSETNSAQLGNLDPKRVPTPLRRVKQQRIEPVVKLPETNDMSMLEGSKTGVPLATVAEMGEKPVEQHRTPATVSARPIDRDNAMSESMPPLHLLQQPVENKDGYSHDQLQAMSNQVEMLLRDFGIEVRVAAVQPGPVITCFELAPAPGIKVSQISNLAKDLARGLSVLSVRVVEVIPGKSVVGLEIPNQHREIVYLQEIVESPAYSKSTAPMTLALGKDIGGHPVVANLAKMPHLLVAGTTGSGKSVAINAMLLSMLYKATPREVRLILVDPKMLELSIYEDIPHLLAPVVTDMNEAANALRWCVVEMERRYKLMAALKVRNITGYNRHVSDAIAAAKPIPDPLYKPVDPTDPDVPSPTLEPLPFIVVVIDELADMMMIVGKKVEELIARLAQKARAAGIHLILATQRPSVDVITGLIKANIPTRIAFQVSSKVDSRTILDQMGAEQLLGYGDMLYLPPGSGLPKRIHGAFVDDHEVQNVVAYLRQMGTPDYVDEVLEEPMEPVPGLAGQAEMGMDNEIDPLYDQAVRIVTETRRGSISAVQRRLKIGYNRAARIIEEMEAAGIVGPAQTNGNRQVLAPPPPDV